MNKLDDKEKQYSKFLNYKKNAKKQNSRGLLISLIIFMLLVMCSIFLVFSKLSLNFPNALFASQEKTNETTLLKKNSFKMFSKRQNILLLGVDAAEPGKDPFEGNRSDTIILLNIDLTSKTINAVSIPRDSKVYLAQDKGVQKINAAHAIGGVDLTKKTIEETLGLRIDKYVVVNQRAVCEMVDALGGVPLFVEKDMTYHDYSGKLHINLKKGLNILDGEKAEGYLRYRYDALGDISRIGRQQWFLRSLLKKLQTTEALTKIPELLNIASTYVMTDLSLYEMSHLVALLRNLDMSRIEFATLPGAPSKRGYLSYWILDPEKTQEVLDRMIYRINQQVEEKPKTAGILYIPSKEETAMQIKQELTEAGYEVNCIGRAALPHNQIIGHNKTISPEFIKWLKKRITDLKTSQFVYDPVKMYCVDSDFTIIVSDS